MPEKHFQNVSVKDILADAELVSLFSVLLSGVHAGDVSRLSVESCAPSLTRAILSSKRQFAAYVAKNALKIFRTRKNSAFSLVGGNGELCQALHRDLLAKHVDVRLNFNLERVQVLPGNRFNLVFGESRVLGPFDLVFFAVSSEALSAVVFKDLIILSLFGQI